MEANTSNPTGGNDVPSLLANVEVSHLDGFDITTPGPSPRPPLSPRRQQQLNHDTAGRPSRVSFINFRSPQHHRSWLLEEKKWKLGEKDDRFLV